MGPIELLGESNQLENAEKIAVRERYVWKDRREREDRPIDFYLQDILNSVHANQVTIVQAEPGVGKTSRIGQAIIDNDPEAQVILTQTHRSALRRNGNYIRQELGDEGDVVGWKLKGEPRDGTEHPRLALTIDQSLTNKIRREKKLPEGMLIIDEAHERTVQLDVLLALINKYLPDSPNTKVVITSATIDTKKFQEFYKTQEPITVFGESLHRIEVNPIELRYGEHHTQGAIRALKERILDKFAKDELSIPTDDPDSEERIPISQGKVLTLLPGKEDIRQVIKEVKKYAVELGIGDRVEFVEAHSQSEPDEMRKIDLPLRPNTLRIIVSTEIFRNSATLPDLFAVVDSLQVKRNYVDKNRVSHLGKIPVSGAEADQGKGRVGRLGTGLYIPVTFGDEYQRITDRSSPEYWPVPAIQRESISSVVLQIAALDLNIRSLPMLDKPEDEKIEVTIKRLQLLGLLDEEENITEKGQMIVEFPIDPERALVLLEAQKRDVLPESIIAMSVLENQGIKSPPPINAKITVSSKMYNEIIQIIKQEEYITDFELKECTRDLANGNKEINFGIEGNPLYQKARLAAGVLWRHRFADNTHSDFYATVQAYRSFMKMQADLHQAVEHQYIPYKERKKWIEDKLRTWCTENFLDYKKLIRTDQTCAELEEEIATIGLGEVPPSYKNRVFDNDELTKSLLSGLIDGVNTKNYNSAYKGPKGENIIVTFASVCNTNPQLILAENLNKGKNAIAMYTDMVVPVEETWLREVAPQLWHEERWEGSGQYSEYYDSVTATYNIKFGNLTLRQESRAISGVEAVPAFVDELVRNPHHLYIPEVEANQAIIKELKQLYIKAGRSPVEVVAKVKEWYIKQLGTISSKRELNKAISNGSISLSMTINDIIPEEEHAKLIEGYADTITINGKEYPINYQYYELGEVHTRSVIMNPEDVMNLPEIPTLPSGETIQVTLVGNHGTTLASSTDLQYLRSKAALYVRSTSTQPSVSESLQSRRSLQTEIYSISAQLPTNIRHNYIDRIYNYGDSNDDEVEIMRLENLKRDLELELERQRFIEEQKRETQLHLEEQAEQRKQAQLQDSRIKVYDTFVKTELDELITFVRTQKKTDIGKWRLAVAALVMKGTEGVEQVIDAGISDSETLEDIKKAFDKSITEARKILDSRNAIEVQYKVEQIKKALEQYKMLLTIHTHPLVLDYIGTAPTPEVRRLLRAEVLQRMQKMRGLPNSEELENIVMDAIDHITS